MARPTKINEALVDEICNLHSQGLDIKHVADEVGINRGTLHRWLKKGETSGSGRYYMFYQKWLKAHEKYLIVRPPKNTYNKKYARELIPGYAKFRRDVLARDGACVCCGYDDELNVHHIYGTKEHPELAADIDNGVTLCKYCHRKYHHIYKREDVNPSTFYEFMKRFKVIR